jgi:hypothetical protein
LAILKHHSASSNNPPSEDRTTISLRIRAETAVGVSLNLVNEAPAVTSRAL